MDGNVDAVDSDGATDTSVVGGLAFTDGVVNLPAPALSVGGVAVDLSTLTGYAGLTTVSISSQNGRPAGTLDSFNLTKDGTLVGSFSNGSKEMIVRIRWRTSSTLADWRRPAHPPTGCRATRVRPSTARPDPTVWARSRPAHWRCPTSTCPRNSQT